MRLGERTQWMGPAGLCAALLASLLLSGWSLAEGSAGDEPTTVPSATEETPGEPGSAGDAPGEPATATEDSPGPPDAMAAARWLVHHSGNAVEGAASLDELSEVVERFRTVLHESIERDAWTDEAILFAEASFAQQLDRWFFERDESYRGLGHREPCFSALQCESRQCAGRGCVPGQWRCTDPDPPRGSPMVTTSDHQTVCSCHGEPRTARRSGVASSSLGGQRIRAGGGVFANRCPTWPEDSRWRHTVRRNRTLE